MALFLLTNLPYFLVRSLNDIFLLLISLITTKSASQSSKLIESNDPGFEHRPSPLLVPVPLHVIINSTKEHLTVSKYGHTDLARVSETCDDHDCVVCLTVMMGCDEVRRLPNCKHVFHRDCIDAWIDKCKTTCPVCRSDLYPGRGGMFGCGKDPWRGERMIYLFGEDFFM